MMFANEAAYQIENGHTQKCAKTLTLNERSIKWSGVSNNARPDTTPALLISIVICKYTKEGKRRR